MTSFRTPNTTCPNCQSDLNALAPVGHKQEPIAGDFTVCLYCTAIMKFVEPMPSVVPASRDDIQKLDIEECRMLLRVCREIQQEQWLRARMN